MRAFKCIFTLLFVLACSTFSYANPLEDSVNEYLRLSNDIAKWQEELKTADESATSKINQEIKGLKNSKGALITGFAALINGDNLNRKFFKAIKASKNKYKDEELEFYSCLEKLHKSFVDGSSTDVRSIIDASIERIKASKNASAHTEALIELLTYLRLNASIFKSNIVVKTLGSQSLINAINSIFPNWLLTYINVGKLTICVFIFGVVFFGFRKLVLRLLTIALMRALPQDKRAANDHFFAKLRRPVVGLFFIYTVRLCVLVFLYPAPLPPLASKLFAVFNVLLFTWMIIAIFNSYGMLFITHAASRSQRRDAINLMIKIANYIILAIALLVSLAFLGFDVSAIIASLGIGGLAVALAAKDMIANFFASVLLHFDNSFSQGDWVQIGSTEGTVVEIGMRKTTIRTFDNSLVFVPNSSIMTTPVKNWSRRKLGRKIGLSIGLEYSCSAAVVAKIMSDIRAMLQNHPDIAQPSRDTFATHGRKRWDSSLISRDDLDGYKNTLFVYLDEFAASSINIYVYCFSKSTVWGEFLRVKEDVMLRIMQIIQDNGAGFAFPSQSVYLESTPLAEKLATSALGKN